MVDLSGRDCKLGDLMLGLRNKGHLNDLEYTIVVADGKVYNGVNTYTIGNYGYLCALTEKELAIRAELQKSYQEKMYGKMKQKNVAKNLKVGDLFKTTSDSYGLYIGKINLQSNDIDVSSDSVSTIFKKGGHCYIYFSGHSSCRYSNNLLNELTTSKTLDLSRLPDIIEDLSDTMYYRLGEFHMNSYLRRPGLNVTVGKTTTAASVLENIKLIVPDKPVGIIYKDSNYDRSLQRYIYTDKIVYVTFN